MSKNNARRYEGTTFSVNKNPLVLRFNLTDSQFDATYEIDLVPDELDSKLTFCKEVSRTISGRNFWIISTDRVDAHFKYTQQKKQCLELMQNEQTIPN